MTTRAEFHFSWVYTFSATPNSSSAVNNSKTSQGKLVAVCSHTAWLKICQTFVQLFLDLQTNTTASYQPPAQIYHDLLHSCFLLNCYTAYSLRAVVLKKKTVLKPGLFSQRPNFVWNNRKKLSQFGHNVQKGRLVNNTVTAIFNTITGQTTEMAQRKKSEITPQSNNSFVVQGSSTTHLERDIKAINTNDNQQLPSNPSLVL